jgi:hypothetical protein
MDKTTRLYNADNSELTTKERFEKMLVDRGMFAEQAEKVMVPFMAEMDGAAKDYHYTWNSPASEYPDAIYTVGFMYLKRHALTWIDANLPKAWYRGMFE